MRTAILTALFTAGLSVLAGCEATSGAKAPVNAVFTVTGPDGKPLKDVVLNLQPTSIAGSPMFFKLTDGTAKADGALPGKYIVFISVIETGPTAGRSLAALKAIGSRSAACTVAFALPSQARA